MLFFFSGTDRPKTNLKTEVFVSALLKKKPSAAFLELNEDTFTREACNTFLNSQGLFEKELIVVVKNILTISDNEKYVKENIKEFKNSKNVFIFVEGKTLKKTTDFFKKHSDKVWLFDEGSGNGKKEKASFNIFSITDAFGKRDKKKTWVLYHEALFHGSAAESLHGMIFWQLKNMIFAKKESKNEVKDKEVLGIKPFVFNKSQSYSKNFTQKELISLSSSLVSLYHEARLGGAPLEVRLEKFILGL